MSWHPEVQVVKDDKWYGNALYFETEREAVLYANDLGRRWTSVRAVRATESIEAVNYHWDADKQKLTYLHAAEDKALRAAAPAIAALLKEQGILK